MLRSEFRFRVVRWPQRLFATLLGEAFLGFLAIVAVALNLFLMLFASTAVVAAIIDAAQWTIIGWFGFEYVYALASAHDRRGFLRNPWRLVDLATVLIPMASALPGVSQALRSSPVLRLVRLVRLVTLGVRASGIVARTHVRQGAHVFAAGPAEVTKVADVPVYAPVPAGWKELLQWLGARGEEWYHVSNPSPAELRELAGAAGLPAAFFETNLLAATYPHLATAGETAAVFFWLPEIDATTGRVERRAMLFAWWENSVLSLSRRHARAIEHMDAPPADTPEERAAFPLRMLGAMVQRVVRQNETLIARLEEELHVIEEVPVRESRPEFFERTFRLKKELSAAQADLWRLKATLQELAARRVRVPGASDASAALFGRLAASAEYLYETVLNTREEVLSVIELHLNIVSFDMNRVMRVLAVVSVLGLIPAVIGGLFGMNLIDNPWPFTLPEVAFAVCFGMIVALYFFFVKGWLR
jgi:Mg2+ and Co2+ transporter CorA